MRGLGGEGVSFLAWIPGHHYSPEDGWELDVAGELPTWWDFETAAEHYFRNRDGWEASWPIVFAITRNDGAEWRCSVDCRQEPTFYADRACNYLEPRRWSD